MAKLKVMRLLEDTKLEQYDRYRELARYALSDRATLLMRLRGDSGVWCAGGLCEQGDSIEELLRERDGSSVLPVCFRLDYDGFETLYWQASWMVELRGERLLYFGDVDHGHISEWCDFTDFSYDAEEDESHTPGQWTSAVQQIQAQIRANKVRKAVLCRQMSLYNPAPWDLESIIAKLLMHSNGTSVFAHQLSDCRPWIGASPEVLFQREGRQISVDSLAGTRQTLLEHNTFTDKDRAEQEVVTEFLITSLEPLCTHVSVSPISHRRADDLEHVYCQVQGVLRDDVNDDIILAALHPTPAVCGSPRDEASQLIDQLELMPRDLYSGVLGYSNGHQTTAVVVLRCAQISGHMARMFGGAGIVADSDPDLEFAECGWKMEVMRRALLDLL